MKQILRVSVLLLSVFLLSACGGSPGGDDNNTGGEAHKTGYRTELYGRWDKSCFQDHSLYMTKLFEFSVDGTYRHWITYYKDSSCKENLSHDKRSGTYVAGGQATDSTGEQTTRLDIKISAETIDYEVHYFFEPPKFYIMYKKSDSDHLLVSDYEMNGLTPATRSNNFDPAMDTYTHQPCGVDDINCLTKDIYRLVHISTLRKIINLGMPIHTGDKPPKIEGIYRISPEILKASNIPNDSYPIGERFEDITIKYHNQNNNDLTVKVDYNQGEGSNTGHDLAAFIVGTGNNFTIFAKVDGVMDGQEYIGVEVYSGTITQEGIKNLYTATFMIDDKGDSGDILIENGQGRVFSDGDRISESVSSMGLGSLRKLYKPVGEQFRSSVSSRIGN